MSNKKIRIIDSKNFGTEIVEELPNARIKRFYKQPSNIRKKEKQSFKNRCKNCWQSFSKWTHTKQATKVFILLLALILVVTVILVFGHNSKMKIGHYFENNVNCGIYSQDTHNVDYSNHTIDNFEKSQINKTQTNYYRSLTFTFKDFTNQTVALDTLFFVLYSTANANYTIKITIHTPNEEDWTITRSAKFEENQTYNCRFPIKQVYSSPNNTYTFDIEFLPSDDNIAFDISQMQIIF